MKTIAILLLALFSFVVSADETKTYRDTSGRTTGTETSRSNADGTSSTTYRNSSGATTGTASERRNSDGSTTTTYRDTQGRTTGTKTERGSN